jgi:hypothetical protein
MHRDKVHAEFMAVYTTASAEGASRAQLGIKSAKRVRDDPVILCASLYH